MNVEKPQKPHEKNEKSENSIETKTKEEPAEERLRKELALAQAKLFEYENLLKRIQADFENFRKRKEKEAVEERDRGKAELIHNQLVVLDSIAKALQTKADNEEFRKGIKMICEKLSEILRKEGLKEITALGNNFDPDRHEAVMQREGDKDNFIVEEFEKGYLFKEKVLRPSKVAVSKIKHENEKSENGEQKKSEKIEKKDEIEQKESDKDGKK